MATMVNRIDKDLLLRGLPSYWRDYSKWIRGLTPWYPISADGENTEVGVNLRFLESICALKVSRMISSTSQISFSLLDLEGFVKLTKSIDI